LLCNRLEKSLAAHCCVMLRELKSNLSIPIS
jgi:hypothetical protein